MARRCVIWRSDRMIRTRRGVCWPWQLFMTAGGDRVGRGISVMLAGRSSLSVVRWRLVELVGWIRSEYVITVSPATMSRMLKAMGYVKLSALPRHHAQNEYALEAFKKVSPTRWRWSRPRSRSARR